MATGDICRIQGCGKIIVCKGQVCNFHRYKKRMFGTYDCLPLSRKHSHSKSRVHDLLHTRKNHFYANVSLPNENGCMEWIGSLNSQGYGQMNIKNRPKGTHRYSYNLFYGEIPSHLEVCHKCDNRKCVAPDHLFLGTRKDNMQDCLNKGRMNLRGLKNYARK